MGSYGRLVVKLEAVSTIRTRILVAGTIRGAIVHHRQHIEGEKAASMVTITFSDRETEKRALAFLIGRFSGRVLRSGEHLVPEAALEALADQNIPFTVRGKSTYEQQMAALRGASPPPVR
jgi:hypothetical protein